jgi:hypothetical protein
MFVLRTVGALFLVLYVALLNLLHHQVLTFLAVHDPRLEPRLDETDDAHDLIGGSHLLPTHKWMLGKTQVGEVTADELDALVEMYSDEFDNIMRSRLRSSGERVQLCRLPRTRRITETSKVDAKWRHFHKFSARSSCVSTWEHGKVTIEWGEGDSHEHHGIIRRMFQHRVFDHTLSPSVLVFEVVECESARSSPLPVVRVDGAASSKFVTSTMVKMTTCFWLPDIPADLARGWSHNIVRYN